MVMNVNRFMAEYSHIHIIELMDFSDFINDEFIKWRGKRKGKGASVAAFARLFGASQPLMTQWMTKGGKIPTSQKYISALYNYFGPEVLQILGITSSKISGNDISYNVFPPALQERLLAAQREIENEFRRRKITGEMPEAEQIAIEIMARHGFKYTTTESVPEEE